MEYPWRAPQRAETWYTPNFLVKDGKLTIPTGPGLGIEINEEYVKERAAVGHRWRNPIWRHKDGSFAEW